MLRVLALAATWLVTLCGPASAQQAPPKPMEKAGTALRSLNVGLVRHAYGSWAAKIADGSFDTATGRTVRWYPHDTDSTVTAALASGRLDIGLMGASVAASAMARGLDLRIFYVLGASADSESLAIDVATFKPGEPKSLQGKVIAVPYGSTPHFRLLETLKRWGASVPSMRIVNLQTAQIAEAWKRGEIDAAVVSDPLAAQLGTRGQRLPLPATSELTGLMVFAATAEFVAQHGVFLSRFVDVIARADEADGTAAKPEARPDSPDVRAIGFMTGLTPEAVAASLARYHPPRLIEQAGPAWLGGGAAAGLVTHLKAAIEVWRWAGRLSGSEPDLAFAVAVEPVQMALRYQTDKP